MIPTAIGVRFKTPNPQVTAAMATWLEGQGLATYTPQTLDGEADNTAKEWNPATGLLNWKPATYAHLARLTATCGMVQVWSFNGYFRGDFGDDSYKTVAWPDPKTGAMLNQDQLPPDLLASYLRRTRKLMLDHKITPWVMFDEPPHKGGADGSLYGWTPEVQARTLKMGAALKAAEFPFGVAFPNYQSLRFWTRLGLSPDWYILNEKSDLAVYKPYLPAGAVIWLYNVRAVTLPKMAEKLAAFDAKGLVQWHAMPWNKGNELPVMFEAYPAEGPAAATAKPTLSALTFAEQVKKYSAMLATTAHPAPAPTPAPTPQPSKTPTLAELAAQIAAHEAEIATLKAQIAALTAKGA